LRIDTAAMGCQELETNYWGETDDERFYDSLALIQLKEELVKTVYFAKQKGFKKALNPVDYGSYDAKELALKYVEEVSFFDNAIRNYNDFMKRGKIREAYEIVDRLKEMELLI